MTHWIAKEQLIQEGGVRVVGKDFRKYIFEAIFNYQPFCLERRWSDERPLSLEDLAVGVFSYEPAPVMVVGLPQSVENVRGRIYRGRYSEDKSRYIDLVLGGAARPIDGVFRECGLHISDGEKGRGKVWDNEASQLVRVKWQSNGGASSRGTFVLPYRLESREATDFYGMHQLNYVAVLLDDLQLKRPNDYRGFSVVAGMTPVNG